MARRFIFSNVVLVSATSIIIILWLLFSPAPRNVLKDVEKCVGINCLSNPKDVSDDKHGIPLDSSLSKCDCNSAVEEALLDRITDAIKTPKEQCPTLSETTNCEMKNVTVSWHGKLQFNGISYNDSLYLPFAAVKSDLELHGEYDETRTYNIKSLKGKVPSFNEDVPKYSTTGLFMDMHTNEVSRRSRVLCVSGRYGIPISTQWHRQGHFYPIQIAQYGLEHFGRHFLSRVKPEVKIIEDSSLSSNTNWEKDPNCKIEKAEDHPEMVLYKCEGSDAILSVKVDSTLHILKATVQFDPSVFSGMAVNIVTTDKVKWRFLYANTGDLFSVSDNKAIFGLSETGETFTLLRDLNDDLWSMLMSKNNNKNKKVDVKVELLESIEFFGIGYFSNLTLMNIGDREKAIAAADWFVKKQNENGGWPVSVTHKIIANVVSHTGSHSAMAQGHAISLLCRIHSITKDKKYIDAAHRGINVFYELIEDNGVVSYLWGNQTIWYEEYSTQPSLHVLNGFIYSLIGLFDLSQCAIEDLFKEKAHERFELGYQSLINTLSVYDNGHGTFYDLRHIASPGMQPNRARWAYHIVHIKQLNYLQGIKPDPLFQTISKRWIGYLKGIHSRHN